MICLKEELLRNEVMVCSEKKTKTEEIEAEKPETENPYAITQRR